MIDLEMQIESARVSAETLKPPEVYEVREEETRFMEEPRIEGEKDIVCEGQLARRPRDNWLSASLALVVGLLPVYFVVFAFLAYHNNHQPLNKGQAAWLLQAAKYGPTAFPIVFAAIIGQLMTVIATWRLERGITIGLLEYLLGTRSLGSAFLAVVKFRILNVWLPLILATWLLSPLGGQSALRMVYSEPSYPHTANDFHYLDLNHSMPIVQGASGTMSLSTSVGSVFYAALASPATSKNGSQDIYTNVQVPMIQAFPDDSGEEGWHNVSSDGSSTLHSALIGLPISNIPDAVNSSFQVETSYMYADCDLRTYGDYHEMIPWNDTNVYTFYQQRGFAGSADMRIRDDAKHMYNMTTPRKVGWQSRVPGQTEAYCNLTTTFIEGIVECNGGRFNCSMTAVRESRNPSWPSTTTVLDGVACNLPPQHCPGPPYSSILTGRFWSLFMNAITPGHAASLTALEQFILTPDAPFSLTYIGEGIIGTVGPQLFSYRFTQLINTYWLALIAPFAVSGNFVYPSAKTDTHSTSTMTGQVEHMEVVLRCHKPWAACLAVLSLLLVAAGVTTAILDAGRKGPSLLDDFVSSLRHNPYVEDRDNAMEDGVDIARRLKYVKVQLGDVQPDEAVGMVVVATATDARPVARLMGRRRYV